MSYIASDNVENETNVKTLEEVIFEENADFFGAAMDASLETEVDILAFIEASVQYFAQKYPFEWKPTAFSRSFNLMFEYRDSNYLNVQVERDCRLVTYIFGVALENLLSAKGINFELSYLYTIDQKEVNKDTIHEGVQTNFLHPKIAISFPTQDLIYTIDFLPTTFDYSTGKAMENYKIVKGGKLAGEVIEKYKLSNDYRESMFAQDRFARFRNRFGAKIMGSHINGRVMTVESSLTRSEAFEIGNTLKEKVILNANQHQLQPRLTEILSDKIDELIVQIASMYGERE